MNPYDTLTWIGAVFCIFGCYLLYQLRGFMLVATWRWDTAVWFQWICPSIAPMGNCTIDAMFPSLWKVYKPEEDGGKTNPQAILIKSSNVRWNYSSILCLCTRNCRTCKTWTCRCPAFPFRAVPQELDFAVLVLISQPQQMPCWRGAGWVGSQTGPNPRLMSKSRFGPSDFKQSEDFCLFRVFHIKKRLFVVVSRSWQRHFLLRLVSWSFQSHSSQLPSETQTWVFG